MRPSRFFFLHGGEFDPTVVDSQVVDAIVGVGELGVAFDLVVLMHGAAFVRRRAENQRRRREIAARIPGQVRVYLSPRQGTALGDAAGCAFVAWEVLRAPAAHTVIHARGNTMGYYASRVARRLRSVRYVYDVRGDVEAEAEHLADELGLAPQRRRRELESIRRQHVGALERASHVLCVSTVLRDRLIERHRLPPERFTVIPCVADTRRFHLDEAERRETRRALGLEERFVVIFPGRFGRWHAAPEMLRVVHGMMQARPDVFFLVLTPDVTTATTLARAELPEGRYAIRSVAHSEVPRYLRAADLGLLLREPHPLNEVACPTKFAEYVLCGLPVLISPAIGDCSPFVAGERAGIVLERPEPADAVKALERLAAEPTEARRARIAGLGERFSRQRAARTMADLYQRLAGD